MNATLAALVRAALDATGASAACVFAGGDDHLVVAAVAGDVDGSLVGTRVSPGTTSAGFVVSSGQPIARSVRPGDPTSSTLAGLLGREPASLLSVPCASTTDIVGALELVDKAGGMFTIDDIELATLLAGIVGPALGEAAEGTSGPPDPAQLSAGLTHLAQVEPDRYAAVAGVLALLLDRG